MIYLDSSVVLAELLGETRHPGPSFWARGPFITSRLLQYEVWVRVHALGLTDTHAEDVARFLTGLDFVELTQAVLARALEPFPVPVRTLDALHLATIHFLRDRGQAPELATYDSRLSGAARRLGVPLVPLR